MLSVLVMFQIKYKYMTLSTFYNLSILLKCPVICVSETHVIFKTD